MTGDVAAVEALVRWDHPERGLLGPGEFLPVAEQTALMRPLTLRVLDHALADCRRWQDADRALGVAVNLAVANLIDRGFPAEQGWFTVKRQAFTADAADPLGLYLGTTGGELWMSGDEGGTWRQIAAHLPEIYSVTVAATP